MLSLQELGSRCDWRMERNIDEVGRFENFEDGGGGGGEIFVKLEVCLQ